MIVIVYPPGGAAAKFRKKDKDKKKKKKHLWKKSLTRILWYVLLSKHFFQLPPQIFRDVCEVVMTSSHSAEAMTAAPDLIQVAFV